MTDTGGADRAAMLARFRAELHALLAAPPSRAHAGELVAFFRRALPALRGAGCDADEVRGLLLPAALQLLLGEELPPRARTDLEVWIDHLLG